MDGDRVRIKRFRRHQEIEESNELVTGKCCSKKDPNKKETDDTFDDPDVDVELEAV